MDFVIDENIPVELIPWLNQRGHNTFSVPKGNSDAEVAAFAKERKSVLLTLDRHFANTLRFPPRNFSGIIRIKIHPSYIEDIIFSLDNLLRKFPKSKALHAKLFILEKDGFFKLKE